MLKFDNTHIFTGYLKQYLSSFNLPMCKVYTKEFADYAARTGKEDPRVVESFTAISYLNQNKNTTKKRFGSQVTYLKDGGLYTYFWPYNQNDPKLNQEKAYWKSVSSVFYEDSKRIPGLTRTLNSPSYEYDTTTHEYLGDYLRFLRDYYNLNLMSLYNCFNNKTCNNLYYKHTIKKINPEFDNTREESEDNIKFLSIERIFDSQDSKYKIYVLPVKLFHTYTIALDSSQGIEMFCGLYNTALDTSTKNEDLITKTYKKINKTLFNQPFLFESLTVDNWNFEKDLEMHEDLPALFNSNKITRWDIINREQDLKLFIKIPATCKSSIVVLEGDFRHFNDCKYELCTTSSESATKQWVYKANHAILNFEDVAVLNKEPFLPISKLQLLAYNTEESYPFADRLIEYLSNSAITSLDKIPDNIKRAQKVMNLNNHYFKVDGLWENKMQKIIYDYLINAGNIKTKIISTQATDIARFGRSVDPSMYKGTTKNIYIDNNRGQGYYPKLGFTSRSTLYDVLGYIDKDAEKWYAYWKKEGDALKPQSTIQNVDIYNGLFDL